MLARTLSSTLILLALHQTSSAQTGVAINADGAPPHPAAMLDIDVSALPDDGKLGLLLPRITSNTQRTGIPTSSTAAGLLVYQTDPGAQRGIQYFNGSAWVRLGNTAWNMTGNAGTSHLYFLGTTDTTSLRFRVENTERLRITRKGQWLPGPASQGNVLIGREAGEAGAAAPTTNANNVLIGEQAGRANTGARNTAVGPYALLNAVFTFENTAVGHRALQSLTTGSNNTAIGNDAGVTNANVSFSTTAGNAARAGQYGTAIGSNSSASGEQATALGYGANAAYANSTAIGTGSITTAPDQVRIGNTTTTHIGGYAPWTDLSDIRFKTDVRPFTDGLRLIRALRPISYRLDITALDKHIGRTPSSPEEIARKEAQVHAGFSAQELQATINRLGVPIHAVHQPQNAQDTYGVNYAALVVPLVVATQELDAAHARLEATLADLEERLRALEARSLPR